MLPVGSIVVSHFFGKTLLSLNKKIFRNTTICSFLFFTLYSVFNDRLSLPQGTGGLKWTRTTEDNCLSLGQFKDRFRLTSLSRCLVGSSGLEPPTSRLSGARSNQLSYKPMRGVRSVPDGDDGIRTHDPLLAGQVLSQLSYTPMGRIRDAVSAMTYSPTPSPV